METLAGKVAVINKLPSSSSGMNSRPMRGTQQAVRNRQEAMMDRADGPVDAGNGASTPK